jgi:hypothetical protein
LQHVASSEIAVTESKPRADAVGDSDQRVGLSFGQQPGSPSERQSPRRVRAEAAGA